jgi:endonuclease/exonuclease/phosphatase family metal-dependent hydrolase
MKLNPLCLAAFSCFGLLFPAPAQQVKVMQWNVQGNLGTTTAQSGAAAAAIGRILNYLQPDVLLINEVADGTAQVNTSALTQWVTVNLPYLASGTFYVAVSTESSDIQRNAAISRYPILAPFTYADVSSSLRGMHSFQLQLAGTNRLQVFHVHLKCCSDGTSCQTKQDEAQLFSSEIATWAATNSAPYIHLVRHS